MAKTANNCDTFESSLDPVVDLFFIIGSSRGKDITAAFERALGADEERTLRMLFWARDVRGGSGERQTFRNLMSHLETNRPHLVLKLLKLVPEYGRWDDLLIFKTTTVQKEAFEIIRTGLENPNTRGLCAKWMPREKSKDKAIASALRKHFALSPKQYRKLLANLTKAADVVEVKMCAKDWGNIDFNKVPSLAAARYQKAFSKNASETYEAYKTALSSDDPIVRATAKVNASAVFPHDVLKSIYKGDAVVAKAQWEALPNYLEGARILPVVDVSGSMGSWGWWGSSQDNNVTPLDISMSLGLYIADKQVGAFKDVVCTFSSESRLEVLQGDIISKVRQLKSMHWGMSTNIERAFHNILQLAVNQKVPANEMPETLMILSDMEFNQCAQGTAYNTARAAYAKYGYELPKIVFWNINGREGNNPVTHRQDGTALVSGYSPAILGGILGADMSQFTPKGIMDKTLMSERYNPVAEVLTSLT